MDEKVNKYYIYVCTLVRKCQSSMLKWQIKVTPMTLGGQSFHFLCLSRRHHYGNELLCWMTQCSKNRRKNNYVKTQKMEKQQKKNREIIQNGKIVQLQICIKILNSQFSQIRYENMIQSYFWQTFKKNLLLFCWVDNFKKDQEFSQIMSLLRYGIIPTKKNQ